MILPFDLDSQEIAKEYYDCEREHECIYTFIADVIAMRSRLKTDG